MCVYIDIYIYMSAICMSACYCMYLAFSTAVFFFFQPAAARDLEGWRRRDPAPLYVRVHAQLLQDQKRDGPPL